MTDLKRIAGFMGCVLFIDHTSGVPIHDYQADILAESLATWRYNENGTRDYKFPKPLYTPR